SARPRARHRGWLVTGQPARAARRRGVREEIGERGLPGEQPSWAAAEQALSSDPVGAAAVDAHLVSLSVGWLRSVTPLWATTPTGSPRVSLVARRARPAGAARGRRRGGPRRPACPAPLPRSGHQAPPPPAAGPTPPG